MTDIRCSRLPLAVACSASVRRPAIIIESDNPAARLGSAGHRYLRGEIEGKPLSFGDLAGMYDVDEDTLRPLAYTARKAWRQIEPYFPGAQSEVDLTPLVDSSGRVRLTGTADVVSLLPDGETVAIGDMKTGWGESENVAQLKGYSLLACVQFDRPQAQAVIIRPRQGTIDVYRWSRAALVEWFDLLAKRLVNGAEVYNKSPENCRYCWKQGECPARKQLVAEALETVSEGDSIAIGGLTPRRAYDAVQFIRFAEAQIEKARATIKQEIVDNGGEFIDEQGYGLRLKQVAQTEIVAERAWPILQAECGDRVFEAVKVHKTKVEKIVADAAPRGQKHAAKAGLMVKLDEAGAVLMSTYDKTELVAPRLEDAAVDVKAIEQKAQA